MSRVLENLLLHTMRKAKPNIRYAPTHADKSLRFSLLRLIESLIGFRPIKEISGKFSDFSSFIRGSGEDET